MNSYSRVALVLIALFISTVLISSVTKAVATSSSSSSSLSSYSSGNVFNKQDFIITNFGIKNGTPFIQVKGEAGRSLPNNTEEVYAYIFNTDKGIFAVRTGEGSFHDASHITLDAIKVKQCIKSDSSEGQPKFSGNTVYYINRNVVFSKIISVATVDVILNDPTSKCKTGKEISQIFSQR
jgi:hypothetical protein